MTILIIIKLFSFVCICESELYEFHSSPKVLGTRHLYIHIMPLSSEQGGDMSRVEPAGKAIGFINTPRQTFRSSQQTWYSITGNTRRLGQNTHKGKLMLCKITCTQVCQYTACLLSPSSKRLCIIKLPHKWESTLLNSTLFSTEKKHLN